MVCLTCSMYISGGVAMRNMFLSCRRGVSSIPLLCVFKFAVPRACDEAELGIWVLVCRIR